VFVRVDDEHDPAFTRRPMRDSEVASGDFQIRAERQKSRRLERLSGQGKRYAVFRGCANDTLARGKHE
jgi:hypothetical protein